MRWITLTISVLLLTSCASKNNSYTLIHKADFIDYGSNPMSHTFYEGSDDTYHYFMWSSGFRKGKWIVNKDEMPFDQEFPKEENHLLFLTKDKDGNYQPLIME